MDTTTLILLIAAVVAVVLAIVLTRALTRSKLLADRQQLETLLDVNGRIDRAVESAEKAKDEVMEARDKAHDDAMKALREQFAESMGQMKDQVKAATDELLKARQKEFKEASSEAIGNLLSPVKEKMEELRKEMSTNSDVHKTAESAIKSNVEHLMSYTGKVAKSADQLAAAFKYGNKLQGTWGETILEEILSSQGLTKGVHFDVQPTITDADGHTVTDLVLLGPDLAAHLNDVSDDLMSAKERHLELACGVHSLLPCADGCTVDFDKNLVRSRYRAVHLHDLRFLGTGDCNNLHFL